MSIYFPGISRHLTLIQIDTPTLKKLKTIINSICEELYEKNIFMFGVTTDNASNFEPVGMVFCEILKLINAVTNIDDPDNFGFRTIVIDRISIGFSQNLDYIIVEF